jgi:hypothetical protein
MNGPSLSKKSCRVANSLDLKSISVICLFGLASLIMGVRTIYQGFYTFRHGLTGGSRGSQHFIAATLTAGLLTCCLFAAAAWLAYSCRHSLYGKSRLLANAVLLTALYVPFFWTFTADRWEWMLMSPVLPGFVAGIFTKQADSRVLLLTACSIDTALIFFSLTIIRNRHWYGFAISTAIALTVSAFTSYAAYCAMRA